MSIFDSNAEAELKAENKALKQQLDDLDETCSDWQQQAGTAQGQLAQIKAALTLEGRKKLAADWGLEFANMRFRHFADFAQYQREITEQLEHVLTIAVTGTYE